MPKLKEIFLEKKINERIEQNSFRQLTLPNKNAIDFSSNDYLGFSKSIEIQKKIYEKSQNYSIKNGSTGSRLLSGNSLLAQNIESELAIFHKSEAALLYNSGYDANLGLLSSLAQKEDTYIADELVHASLIDGMRLTHAKRFKFKHNETSDLKLKLKNATGNKFVIVESIYSMDGDAAPLKEISEICIKHQAYLIVDEAHAIGVFGKKGTGLCQALNIHRQVFARIVTFGKGIGGHGAAIIGSNVLKNYLINFSRSFIYTTAAPIHSLLQIQSAYEQLAKSEHEIQKLKNNIAYFNQLTYQLTYQKIESFSPIQSIIIKGNEKTKKFATYLQSKNLDIRAILSPTVPVGMERLRICLHSFNSFEEIQLLVENLDKFSPHA